MKSDGKISYARPGIITDQMYQVILYKCPDPEKRCLVPHITYTRTSDNQFEGIRHSDDETTAGIRNASELEDILTGYSDNPKQFYMIRLFDHRPEELMTHDTIELPDGDTIHRTSCDYWASSASGFTGSTLDLACAIQRLIDSCGGNTLITSNVLSIRRKEGDTPCLK